MGRFARGYVIAVLAVVTAGCSDWTPIRNARDVEGMRAKIETGGKPSRETVIDELVVCDDPGYIVAKRAVDCREGPPLTYDTRRDKVSVYTHDGMSNVQVVVLSLVATILIPAAIAGSIYLGGGI